MILKDLTLKRSMMKLFMTVFCRAFPKISDRHPRHCKLNRMMNSSTLLICNSKLSILLVLKKPDSIAGRICSRWGGDMHREIAFIG